MTVRPERRAAAAVAAGLSENQVSLGFLHTKTTDLHWSQRGKSKKKKNDSYFFHFEIILEFLVSGVLTGEPVDFLLVLEGDVNVRILKAKTEQEPQKKEKKNTNYDNGEWNFDPTNDEARGGKEIDKKKIKTQFTAEKAAFDAVEAAMFLSSMSTWCRLAATLSNPVQSIVNKKKRIKTAFWISFQALHWWLELVQN